MQWAQVMMSLGSALEGLGFREQTTANLDESVKVRRAALEIITRDNSPLEWATTMNSIGSSLVQLGNREQKKERFEEANKVFEQALTVIVSALTGRTKIEKGLLDLPEARSDREEDQGERASP